MTTIVGAFPTTIKNGDTEDATVVMALFAYIQSQVNGNACPATSGSLVLKGDGSGGTTAATPGTDYFSPGQFFSAATGANTKPQTVAFSATPAFDASKSNVHYLAALTTNVSPTISNPTDGQTISIRFQQDATGGRTVTLPASVHATGGPQAAANSVSWLTITYVASASRWEGTWAAIP